MFRAHGWSKGSPEVRKWRSSGGFLRFSLVTIVLLICGVVGILTSYILSKVFSTLSSVNVAGVLASLSPVYIWGFIIGILMMGLVIILHQDGIAVTIVLAIHIYFDWYLGFTFIGLLLTLSLFVIWLIARQKQHKWVTPHAFWLWVLFLILAIFPAMRVSNVLYAADYYLNVIFTAFIMVWMGILIARDHTQIRRCFQILAFFGALMAIHTIIEAATGTFLFGSSQSADATLVFTYLDPSMPAVHRAESFFSATDTNGAFFAFMFFIPLALFTMKSSLFAKIIYVAEIFVILLALLFTYSAGSWLATFVGVIVFAILVGNARDRVRIFLFLITVGIVGFIGFSSQLTLLYHHAADPGELSLRTAVWQTGIRVIETFPLTGLGIGRNVYLLGAEPYRVPAQYILVNHPHDSYLEFAALGGLPIGIAFLLLLAITLGQALRNWMHTAVEYRPLFAGGIAAAIALSWYSLSDAGWTAAPLVTIGWLVLGMVASPLIGRSLRQRATQPVETKDVEIVPIQARYLDSVKQSGPYDRRDTREPSREMTTRPMAPLEEIKDSGTADAPEQDEDETTKLPVFKRMQAQTRKGEQTHPVSATRPLLVADDLSIADQPTLRLLAVSIKAETANSTLESNQASSVTQSYLALAFEMVKNSGIYAVGALASPLVSLVITPFLTQHLSRSEFGGLAILYTVIDLVTVITQLGLSPAFFRAYNSDYESPRDRLGVLATTIILLSLISLALVTVMVLAAPWLSLFLFGSKAFSGPIKFAALVIVLENLALPGVCWLRAEKRAVLFSVLSIANLLLTLGTTIVLVGVLHLDVSGALLAKGAGFAAIIIYTIPAMLLLLGRHHSLRLRTDIVRNMLFFGAPTIFSDIASWILQLSDRYLLSLVGSLAQTASYSVAYTLGGVLSPVVLAPWGLAWVPVMYAIAKREDAARIFQFVFRWFSSVLLLATFALSLLSTLVLEVFFPLSYHSAEPIIPLIALSTLFSGVYYMFMTGVYIRRKTTFSIFFMSTAAIFNVVLNIFLIPRFGAMGAAISTLLAYIALAAVTNIVNQKIYPINFEIGSFTIKLGVGAALYVGSNLLSHAQNSYISWGISLAAVLLYGVFLMLLGGISPKTVKQIFRYIQAVVRKGERKTYA